MSQSGKQQGSNSQNSSAIAFFLRIPSALHDNIYDFSVAAADKLNQFGNALSGHTDSSNVIIADYNYNYLEKLRKSNKEKYNALADFAYIYETMPFDKRLIALSHFFSNF